MRKRKQEEVVLPQEIWKKVKEHSRARGLPPRGARTCMRRLEWKKTMRSRCW